MAQAVAVTYTIRDAKGKTSSTKVHVPSGHGYADYIEFGVAMGSLIAALVDGEIVDIGVSIPLTDVVTLVRTVAHGLSDIAEKALFAARTAIGAATRFLIPTFNEAYMVSGTDQIDTEATEVAAVLTILEEGVTVDLEEVRPQGLREDDVTSVTESREIFRKYN